MYYIAQYPVLKIDEGSLHFTPWQTCSIEHHLGFSGKYPITLQLMNKDYSHTNVTTFCSQVLIHIADWTGAM